MAIITNNTPNNTPKITPKQILSYFVDQQGVVQTVRHKLRPTPEANIVAICNKINKRRVK